MLYTETDLEESMDKIETINFHEVKEVAGIKFWCYHAGHVLGAAMFMIEIAGVKVGVVYSLKPAHLPSHTVSGNDHARSLQLLYTGDFSRQEDRHLMAAEIPSVKPDILITVSTVYAGHMMNSLCWTYDFFLQGSIMFFFVWSHHKKIVHFISNQ